MSNQKWLSDFCLLKNEVGHLIHQEFLSNAYSNLYSQYQDPKICQCGVVFTGIAKDAVISIILNKKLFKI